MADMAIASQVLLSKSNVSISAETTLVDSDDAGGASSGDIIEYNIKLNNTGTTTLNTTVVLDPILEEQLQR